MHIALTYSTHLTEPENWLQINLTEFYKEGHHIILAKHLKYVVSCIGKGT